MENLANHEHALVPTQKPSTPRSRKDWKAFVHKHQIPLTIAGFLLLPLIILGFVALASWGGKTNEVPIAHEEVEITPTERPTATPEEEPEEEEPTATPTKKLTGTPKLTASITPTSAPKLANLYFHKAECTFHPQTSVTATPTPLETPTITSTPVPTPTPSETKKLDGTTFANSSEVPSTARCSLVFQNVEDIETGDITYLIKTDSDQVKKENVGKLKKGNYPTSEFKEINENISLKTSTGSHSIKIELNPDKTFSEANTGDNVFEAKYTVN